MSQSAQSISPNPDTVLAVENLRVQFHTDDGSVTAVDGISFEVGRGRTVALVGESGSGKSVTGYSILRLIQPPGRIVDGSIVLHSSQAGRVDITALSDRDEMLYKLRGGLVSMIFQEPMTALSPVHTVGSQIAEAILLHQPCGTSAARAQVVAMLQKVGIPDAERRYENYPHEMSGGMRQRVVIAMALVCRPELLIADEPTTALDVTIQAQVLGLIRALKEEIGCSVLMITHDFGVVAQMADDVIVMQHGQIVEQGAVREVLKNPRHPYTRALLDALPSRRKGVA